MRKSNMIKRVLAAVMVCVMLFALTACATKLSGTYTSKGLLKQSFTFMDDNKVKMSAFGLEIEGEYKIDDDKLIITYSLGGLHYDWEKSFKKDGSSIYIDGTEFVKEK